MGKDKEKPCSRSCTARTFIKQLCSNHWLYFTCEYAFFYQFVLPLKRKETKGILTALKSLSILGPFQQITMVLNKVLAYFTYWYKYNDINTLNTCRKQKCLCIAPLQRGIILWRSLSVVGAYQSYSPQLVPRALCPVLYDVYWNYLENIKTKKDQLSYFCSPHLRDCHPRRPVCRWSSVRAARQRTPASS